MNLRKHVFLLLGSISGMSCAYSQSFTQPNIGLKSHETLEISKVETASDKTVVFISIENRIEGGNFCADRNIYIIDSDGQKLKLEKAAGIPVCPDSYKFKSKGEKLQFTLDFPPLNPGIKWIDIVEECYNNCFSFYGVTLDNDLNKKLDEGFSSAEKGEISKAISIFKGIIDSSVDNQNGSTGALYADIITLEYKSGNISSAREWYKKMLSSKAPRLDLYIKNVNSIGMKF